jgi:AAA15 family ATPase/GTPase
VRDLIHRTLLFQILMQMIDWPLFKNERVLHRKVEVSERQKTILEVCSQDNLLIPSYLWAISKIPRKNILLQIIELNQVSFNKLQRILNHFTIRAIIQTVLMDRGWSRSIRFPKAILYPICKAFKEDTNPVRVWLPIQ